MPQSNLYLNCNINFICALNRIIDTKSELSFARYDYVNAEAAKKLSKLLADTCEKHGAREVLKT